MKNKSIKEFFKPFQILLFLFIFGCSVPKLFVESSMYSFNDTEVGESVDKEIILINNGKSKLKINDITISGEGYNMQNQNNAIIISPNQSYTLNINFSPVEPGNSSGLLVINSNNPENKMLKIKLKGEGIEQKFPELMVSTKSLDFQKVNIDSSLKESLILENTGDANLLISDLTIIGEGFNIDNKNLDKFSIAPNQTFKLKIEFLPLKQGHFSGVLNINSNDERNRMISVSLKGEGYILAPPEIRISPQTLNFSNVLEDQSLERTLTIYNDGKSPLYINDLNISEQAYSVITDQFSYDAIPPYGRRNLVVSFRPSNNIDYPGQLEIITNDPINSKKIINLVGTGIEADPDPKGIDLGQFTHDDVEGTQQIQEGSMDRNSGKIFLFQVQRIGDFEILITPGYDLISDDFKYSGNSSFTDKSRYKRFIKEQVQPNSKFQVEIKRNNNSPDNFKFIFKLFPR